jgi:hypothetical protein
MKTKVSRFRIVSGGQTGVDRAALDAGIESGFEIGGWCPKGRRSEDGAIPEHYPLLETPSWVYSQRTEWNVRDSDGTLVVALDRIGGGTQLTIEAARRNLKPCCIVHLLPDRDPGLLTDENPPQEEVPRVVEWLTQNKIRILNVAGPRASSGEGTYSLALDFLKLLFEQIALCQQPENSGAESVKRASKKPAGKGDSQPSAEPDSPKRSRTRKRIDQPPAEKDNTRRIRGSASKKDLQTPETP